MACSVKNCSKSTSGESMFVKTSGKFELCAYHRPFFDGIEDINCDFISQCDCEKPMIYQAHKCAECSPGAIEVTQENLELLRTTATMFHKREAKGKGQEKFRASDFMAWLGLQTKQGSLDVDLLAQMKSDATALFSVMKGKAKSARRANKAQLIEEAKEAGVQVAVDKIVDKFIESVPTAMHKMGASVETCQALQAFFATTVGKSVILSLLAGTSTYIKVPAKYESFFAALAKELRVKTMRTVGTGALNAVGDLLPTFLTDFNQAVDTLTAPKSETVEHAVVVEVPEYVTAGA